MGLGRLIRRMLGTESYADVSPTDDPTKSLPAATTQKGHSGLASDTTLADVVGVAPSSMPMRRGTMNMLAAIKSMPFFRRCVMTVAYEVAKWDWWVERDGERIDHPIEDILRHPNPTHDGLFWRLLETIYFDVTGNTFNVPSTSDDNLFDLNPIPPTSVRREGDMWRITHNRFRDKVSTDQMIWRSFPDPEDCWGRGSNIGESLADELETSEYLSRQIKGELKNNGIPSFIVTAPGADPDMIDMMEENWYAEVNGPDNFGAGVFIGGPVDANTSFHKIQRSFDEMGGSELRDAQHKLIRLAWGIPPEVIGEITGSNQATSKEATRIMAEKVVQPRLRMMRSAWNHQLLPYFGDTEGLSLAHESPLPEERERKLMVYQEAPWAFTVNDWRTLAGEPPLEGGDVFRREQVGGVAWVDAGEVVSEKTATPDTPEPADTPDNVVYMLGAKQPSEQVARLTAEEIASALQADFVRSQLKPEYEERVREWATDTLDEFDTSPQSFQALNPFVAEEVELFAGEKIQLINETSRENVERVTRETILAEGVEVGQNPRRVAAAIQANLIDEYLEDLPNRAETIARTEMLRASNAGKHMAHSVSGVVEVREWIASVDGRTRDAHLGLDGEQQPIDKPFRVGQAQAMFPGDFGVAELDINCRCTVAAVIEKMTFARRRDIWERYVKTLVEDEQAFATLSERVLREQVQEQVFPIIESTLRRAA